MFCLFAWHEGSQQGGCYDLVAILETHQDCLDLIEIMIASDTRRVGFSYSWQIVNQETMEVEMESS